MRRYFLISLMLLLNFSLLGCMAGNTYPFLQPDHTHETWMSQIDRSPDQWNRGASHWFITGDPSILDRSQAYEEAMSSMKVRVPNFTTIKADGDFDVQIFGTAGPNSVYVYGPNVGIRETIVEVRGNTLCLDQVQKAMYTKRVIIRIGVHQLTKLMHLGCGTVSGIDLMSDHLAIFGMGRGDMYLRGCMNVHYILSSSSGSINLFGAETPSLNIKSLGRGAINVAGNVGIQSIMHRGSGDINIIGANSNDLTINADGYGKIGIHGMVNLKELSAGGEVRVYLDQVRSQCVYAHVNNRACVGLAGSSDHAYIDTYNQANFMGRHFCIKHAYARAYMDSHMNVSAANSIFASAGQRASIYYFGPVTILTRFMSQSGTVIPITSTCCGLDTPAPLLRGAG